MIGLFLARIWARAWPYVVAAGAILVGLFAVRQSGKAAGKQEAHIDQLQADKNAREEAREAATEIERLDDDAVRDRARERMRRNQRR